MRSCSVSASKEHSEAVHRTMPDPHERDISNSEGPDMGALYHFETMSDNGMKAHK